MARSDLPLARSRTCMDQPYVFHYMTGEVPE